MAKDLPELVRVFTPKTLKELLFQSLAMVVMCLSFLAYRVISSDDFIKRWAERNAEIEYMRSHFVFDNFREQSALLIGNRKAESLIIWETEVSGVQASKSVLYAYHFSKGTNDREDWIGMLSPLYVSDQSRVNLTKILEGEVICGELDRNSEVDRLLNEVDGVNYFCSVPVPPTNEKIIGVITLYFKQEPKLTSALRFDMRNASKGIVTERRVDPRMVK